VPFDDIVARLTGSHVAHNARVFLDALREREVPSPTLGGAVVALKEGRPEALLGLASRNDDDPDAARRTIASVLGDTIAHRLLDGMGERLDPWTPAYEALEADDAVPAFEAWLDHHGVRRDLELPPVDRSVDEPPAEQRVRTPAPSRR
jgi:hypothetical protein